MDKQLKSAFRFIDYKINNLQLELNENYNDDIGSIEDILSVSVGINIGLNESHSQAMVKLDFALFQDTETDKYPYKINVEMIGYFEIEGNHTEQEVIKLCKINGTAIMFPYIRSAITDLTKISNVTPLILPTINIHKLIEAQDKIKKS